MLTSEQIQTVYEYDQWANERLWQAVLAVPEDQLRTDIHNGIGSVLTTLVHLVNAMWTWRTRWQGTRMTNALDQDDYPTLSSIRARWQEEEAQVHQVLTTLTDEALRHEVRYRRASAPERECVLPLWQSLLHVINHQTQHRSEIAMWLTAMQHSPGELGMSEYFLGNYEETPRL